MMLLFMFNLWKRHQCVSIGDECHCCTCMFMDFLFLPCHDLEALASKKKSKSKKEPKPPKQQGRTSIHPSFFFHFFEFSFSFFTTLFSLCLRGKQPVHKLHSWGRQRRHVQAAELGQRRLLAFRWEKWPLQWGEGSLRRWRRGSLSVSLALPATSFHKPAANTLIRAFWRTFQGDLFSEEPKPPVAEERKVRNESLKSAGRMHRLTKRVQGIQ